MKTLFNENIALVFQASKEVESIFAVNNIDLIKIGSVENSNTIVIKNNEEELVLDIPSLRDTWFKTSYLLDKRQAKNNTAAARFANYKNQALNYSFPAQHSGLKPENSGAKPKAAIIREKGSN